MPALSVHQCRLGTIAESTRQCNSCKDAQVIGPTMRTVVTVLALAAERVFFSTLSARSWSISAKISARA